MEQAMSHIIHRYKHSVHSILVALVADRHSSSYRARQPGFYPIRVWLWILLASVPIESSALSGYSTTAIPPTRTSIRDFQLSFRDTVKQQYDLIPRKRLERPLVGLALSGGGLRGITQIAVLKELETADIPVDFIAGTSIGSVVGGLWAAGYSATEIWQELQKVDLSRLLVDSPQRSALLMGKKNLGSRAFLQFRMDGLSPSARVLYPRTITNRTVDGFIAQRSKPCP